jgi:hypothetical protein
MLFQQKDNNLYALAALSPGAREVVLRLIWYDYNFVVCSIPFADTTQSQWRRSDTSVRFGDAQLVEIQAMNWFEGIDWTRLRHHDPPFIPQLENDTDTTYFGANPESRAQNDPELSISLSTAPSRKSDDTE